MRLDDVAGEDRSDNSSGRASASARVGVRTSATSGGARGGADGGASRCGSCVNDRASLAITSDDARATGNPCDTARAVESLPVSAETVTAIRAST